MAERPTRGAVPPVPEGYGPARTPGGGASVGLLVLGILLVAANLRPAITAVGPLLDSIGRDTGLGATGLGLLAAVPLLAFGAVSPLVHGLSGRFGAERTVLAALLLLVAGTLLRSAAGPDTNLWLGTFIVGAAIAIGNVLIPALLKRDFPDRMAGLTGAYSAVLGGIAALGAGLSVPLSQLDLGAGPLGWRPALAAFGLLALPAVLLWVPWLRRARGTTADGPAPGPEGAGPRRGAVWRSAVAWQVTVYMGMQSLVFYVLASWLPTVEGSYGRSEVGAGWDMMLFQLVGVVSSLLTPLVLRGRMRAVAPVLPSLVTGVAVAGMMAFPAAMVPWMVLAGFGSGGSLVVALALFGMRTRNHREASALSGMAQSLGYLMAAGGPPLFGALYAGTDGWVVPFGLVLAACGMQALVGALLGRGKFAFDG